MNVFNLEIDELEIEFAVRNIPFDEINQVQVLQDRVLAEEAGDETEPDKMHTNAAKRPDIEINLCRSRLRELQQNINSIAELDAGQQLAAAKKIESRLMHVAGRLSRATASRNYGKAAEQVLESSRVLLTSLKLYLNDLDKLNESIEAAKAVNFNPPQVPEVPCSQVETDEQTYAMTCMMDQVRQLAQQVAELSKQCSDQRRQLNEKPASSRVTFSDATSSPVHPVNSKTTFQPPDSLPPPPQTATISNHPMPTSSIGSQPSQYPMVQMPDTLPTSLIGNQQLPYATAQMPGFQPTSMGSHYHVPSTTARFDQTPGMAYANFSNFPPISTAYTPYMNNDVHSNRHTPDHRGLSRSGLSFDGSPTGTPINLFLFQIETLAASMHLDHDKLLTQVSFLLKGVAAHWYWTFRQQNTWVKWPELKQRLIERFQNRRPDSDIENEIESRKQLPTQSFLEFYQQIWELTIQLSVPYSDHQLMKILRKNMRPGLRYQLTDRKFNNIGELISSCTSWENTWTDLKIDPDSFAPGKRDIPSARYVTPRQTINELHGDMNQDYYNMSYGDPNYGVPQVAAMHQPNVPANTSPYLARPPIDRTDPSYVICFNCDDLGHVFADCLVPPTRSFCYRCGLKDTITPKCTRCAENYQRRQWRTGNQGSPRNFQPGPTLNSPPTAAQRTTLNHPK